MYDVLMTGVLSVPDLVTAGHGALASIPMEVPNPGGGTQPPGFNKFSSVMGWSKWIALGVCVVGLIVAAASMAIQSRRGEGGEHASRIGIVMVAVIVISAAYSIVGFLAG